MTFQSMAQTQFSKQSRLKQQLSHIDDLALRELMDESKLL